MLSSSSSVYSPSLSSSSSSSRSSSARPSEGGSSWPEFRGTLDSAPSSSVASSGSDAVLAPDEPSPDAPKEQHSHLAAVGGSNKDGKEEERSCGEYSLIIKNRRAQYLTRHFCKFHPRRHAHSYTATDGLRRGSCGGRMTRRLHMQNSGSRHLLRRPPCRNCISRWHIVEIGATMCAWTIIW